MIHDLIEVGHIQVVKVIDASLGDGTPRLRASYLCHEFFPRHTAKTISQPLLGLRPICELQARTDMLYNGISVMAEERFVEQHVVRFVVVHIASVVMTKHIG